MTIDLRKLSNSDIKYFAKWWRDKELLALTSGFDGSLTDEDVEEYFNYMINKSDSYDLMIVNDKDTIGHISLNKRTDDWWETQIVIGEKASLGKGYGALAIKKLTKLASDKGITKIFLEVRPDNLRAIKSYEKCGFIPKGIIEYPDNKCLPKTLRMELVI